MTIPGILPGACLMMTSVVLAIATAADGVLPASLVRDLRAATVRVEVHAGNFVLYNSGTVLRRRDKGVLIATTSDQVAESSGDITVWYEDGSSHGHRLPAAIVACDTDMGVTLLQVDGLNLPGQQAIAGIEGIRETTPVVLGGYANILPDPLEPALIRSATISSLRENEDGALAVLQIDAVVLPAMVGGPVVDDQGRLLGMILNASANAGIAFALPATALAAAQGAHLRRTLIEPAPNEARMLQSTTIIYDPFHLVRSATLLIGPLRQGEKARCGSNGKWPALIDHPREVALELKGSSARGQFALSDQEATAAMHQLQLSLTSGTVILAKPEAIQLGRGPRHAITLPATEGGGVNVADGKVTQPTAFLEAIDAPLLGAKHALGELAIQDLIQAGEAMATAAVWARDGQTAYLLCADRGLIIRGSLPAFSHLNRLEIGLPCRKMGLAQGGLLVTVDPLNEVWLLDLTTLAVLRRYTVDGSHGIAASPSQAVAFVSSGARVIPIDTLSGRMLAAERSPWTNTDPNHEFFVPGGGGELELEMPVLAEDGRALYGIYKSYLHRFSIDPGLRMTDQAYAGRIGFQSEMIALSADGKEVALVCRDGNGPAIAGNLENGHPTIKVFSTTHLDEPRVVLKAGKNLCTLAIDSAGHRYLSNSSIADLIMYDGKGVISSMCQIDNGIPPDTMCLALQPQGRLIWVLGRQHAWLAELPGKHGP